MLVSSASLLFLWEPNCAYFIETMMMVIGHSEDFFKLLHPWSSLVKGDEQLDRPNSQKTLELCHACVAYFFWFNINTTAFCLGRSSVHLLKLKSSMLHNIVLYATALPFVTQPLPNMIQKCD